MSKEGNKIVLMAEGHLIDADAREAIEVLNKKVGNINERTKKQTIEIRELKKLLPGKK